MAKGRFFLFGFLIFFTACLLSLCNAEDFTFSSNKKIQAKNLGLHIFYPSDGTVWPSAKFGALRLWDSKGTRWDQIQPARYKWDFSRLDNIVLLAEKKSVDLMLTLGQTPKWASARPDEASNYGLGRAAEPADFNDWDVYVSSLVRRYKGKIKYYEIWNEPRFSDVDRISDSKFFSGSSSVLVALSQRAYQIIKREDPDAVVLSPAFDGGIAGTKRLKAFLNSGGGNWVDGFSYHLYMNEFDPENEIPAIYTAIRQVLAGFGYENKPIFNTETGFLTDGQQKKVFSKFANGPLSRVLSDVDAAGLMARSIILALATGIDSVYWFSWDSYSMGMTTDQRGNKPNAVGIAYGELYGWLVGSTLDGCHKNSNSIWMCSLNRNGTRSIVVWSKDDASYTLPSRFGSFREIVSLDSGVSPFRLGSAISIGSSPKLIR